MEWERVEWGKERCPILGGWLLQTFRPNPSDVNQFIEKENINTIFIPDSKHEWDLNIKYNDPEQLTT